MIVDVHNLNVKEAIDLIKLEIKKAYKLNITQIEVIHGFNGGGAIKKRLHELKDPLVTSIICKPNNNGSSLINIKMKLF